MKKIIFYDFYNDDKINNFKERCKCIDNYIKYNKLPNYVKCSYSLYNYKMNNNYKTKLIIYKCCKNLLHI